MSEFFYGWDNGSKCKKLIRNLQGRLKILRDNRSYEAKQLREDISQLLHHELQHHAFDKAEKLLKNEHEVIIYSLLDNFCEFMIDFSYTNKYKDFPYVMDQAVSSLIFASSRIRDLPELIQIRKLFRNFYGERFAHVALELLPGNLVDQQMKDSFSIISEPVSVEMKLTLMNETATNCLKSRPLFDHSAGESSPEGDETSEDETWSLVFDDKDVDASILDIYSSSESQNCIKQSVHSSHSSCSISTSSPFSDSVESLKDHFDFSDCEFIDLVLRTSSIPFGVDSWENSLNRNRFKDEFECNKFDKCREENPSYLCKTEGADYLMYRYLESLSPEEKEEFIQDGLICMKALSMPPERLEKLENSSDIYRKEQCKKKHLKREFRRKPRNRSVSVKKSYMNDSESAIYYGVNSYGTSTNRDRVNEEPELKKVEKCSDENPCYLCKTQGADYLIHQCLESLSPGEKEEFIQDGLICMRSLSLPFKRVEKHAFAESLSSKSRRKPKRSNSVKKGCMIDSESAIYYGVDSHETPQNKNHLNAESKCKKFDQCSAKSPCYLCESGGVDYLIYQSFESLSPEEKDEFIRDGLVCKRALSMLPRRLHKCSSMESTSSITTSTCHVHPKLPDYDDLYTRFIALKQAYLGCKE